MRLVLIGLFLLTSATVGVLGMSADAWADTLRMRDGKAFEGWYLGGTKDKIRFQFTKHGNQVREIPVGQVATMELSPRQASAPGAGKPSPHAGQAVTIPAGTKLMVAFPQELRSGKNAGGTQFKGILEGNLAVGGVVVARQGSEILGKVLSSRRSGRLVGRAEMSLTVTHIKIDGQLYPMKTGGYRAVGQSQALKTGRNAALGAAVGGAFGGKKGAGKGAAIGAAASVLTRGQEIRVPAGTLMEFELQAPAQVKAAR